MTTKITVPLDTEAARWYTQAPPEIREKVRLLLSLQARELMFSAPSLQEIMDEVARRAQERGLTPEILETLLNAE